MFSSWLWHVVDKHFIDTRAIANVAKKCAKIASAQSETRKGTQDTHTEAIVSSHPKESSKCAPR